MRLWQNFLISTQRISYEGSTLSKNNFGPIITIQKKLVYKMYNLIAAHKCNISFLQPECLVQNKSSGSKDLFETTSVAQSTKED